MFDSQSYLIIIIVKRLSVFGKPAMCTRNIKVLFHMCSDIVARQNHKQGRGLKRSTVLFGSTKVNNYGWILTNGDISSMSCHREEYSLTLIISVHFVYILQLIKDYVNDVARRLDMESYECQTSNVAYG